MAENPVATDSAAGTIREEHLQVGGISIFLRRRPGEGTPVVFVHGNPTNSEAWLPFLERLERPGLAIDLPGFGRSARPEHFDYSMYGYAAFLDRLIEELELERFALLADDWGAGISLILAQRNPERIERLVIIDAVPLLPGYRWHRLARLWRRRGVGELVSPLAGRFATGLALREAKGDRGPMPPAFVDSVCDHYDRGTHRAVVQLYRSAPEDELARAGASLDRITAPALVVWGVRDPYLPVEFGRYYATRLPNATLLEVPRGGHWPWIDQPWVIDRVVEFLHRD